jgi:hypothetical protein
VRRSLFPSDDELPTWLHSLLLVLVVAPFAAPLCWWGLQAIATAHLEPLSGPDFGQFFFGPAALDGEPARVAGLSLVAQGCAFFALAAGFSRLACARVLLRALPWGLIAISVLLSLWVKAHR